MFITNRNYTFNEIKTLTKEFLRGSNSSEQLCNVTEEKEGYICCQVRNAFDLWGTNSNLGDPEEVSKKIVREVLKELKKEISNDFKDSTSS